MAYLIYDTEQEAMDRSRRAWEEVLGRPKNPEDVTEFLNGWRVGLDGRTALDSTGMTLHRNGGGDPEEVETLPEDNWPLPTRP